MSGQVLPDDPGVTETRPRRTRKIDAANLTVNITQLVAIISAAIGATMAYDKAMSRIDKAEERAVQVQSQIGETNERLVKLEGR